MRFARAVGAAGRFMIRLGVLILLLVVYQLWGTGIHTSEAQDKLRKQFAQEQQALAESPGSATGSTTDSTTGAGGTQATLPVKVQKDLSLAVPKPGDPIGIIDIPRINSNFVFVEGVELQYLSEGPGHYPGTPLPGQEGNAAIAGHRTTYKAPFNRIDELKPGDLIFITTLQGHFTYQVLPEPNPDDPSGPKLGHRIVQPTDVKVLDYQGINELTLTACHPKYYATNRIVVHARLVGNPAPSRRGTASHVAPTALAELNNGVPSQRLPAAAWGVVAIAIWFATWFVSQRLKRPGGTRAQRLVRWTPYLVGVPLFVVALYASFEAFSKVLPGAF
ncbi:MAG TPA: class E sortase [Acidimicrobiales bacterium]|nr:class E sortase [Acidimicrobiales bacterium]